jgi:hypothetical protein
MEARDLLQQWRSGVRIAHIAHRKASAAYRRRGRYFGVPATAVSVIVGTTVFAAMSESTNQRLLLIVGTVSILNAVLSGLQTFLNYPVLAEKHHQAGIRFGSLRRKMDAILLGTDEEIAAALTGLREEWDELEEQAPEPAQGFVDKAMQKVAGAAAPAASSPNRYTGSEMPLAGQLYRQSP